MSDIQIKDVIFTANDAARLSLKTIEQRRNEKGVGLRVGIKCVDDAFLPGRPGELIGVLGMTSNYKTGFMQYWSRSAAERVDREGIENRVVFYVTWEQAIEEVVALDLAASCKVSATDLFAGRIDEAMMEQLRVAAMKRSARSLWLIGHSLEEERERPPLTISNLFSAFEMIRVTHNIRPYAVFLDYLQQIEAERGDDRRMQVYYNVQRAKNMALKLGCPVILGSQAGRDTYDQTWGIPSIKSSLESSNFEHTCDKIFGTWLPIKTYDDGETIKGRRRNDEKNLTVSENLFILALLKQRFGKTDWWPLYVDPARNFIGELADEETEERFWQK